LAPSAEHDPPAHHVFTEAGSRMIRIVSLRSFGTFARIEGRGCFTERQRIVDWRETQTLSS
jgi:hypothetical protein